jgi:hypothetical protein
VPCEPEDACLGNNECAEGYTRKKCGQCCDVSNQFLRDEDTNDIVYDDFGMPLLNPDCISDDGEPLKYYRLNGLCEPCPSNPWLLVAMFFSALTVFGCLALVLRKHKVEMTIISIGIDYFQVLSIFSSTRVEWPALIVQLYNFLSAFNFNLNITAPECAFTLRYRDKWLSFMVLPLIIASVLVLGFLVKWVWLTKVQHRTAKIVYQHANRMIGTSVRARERSESEREGGQEGGRGRGRSEHKEKQREGAAGVEVAR